MTVPTHPEGYKLYGDASRYQPYDENKVKQAVKELDGIALRLSIGNYYIDQTFEYVFDMFREADPLFPILAYVVTRPGISANAHLELADRALAGREPDGFVNDAELHLTSGGARVTVSEMRALQEGVTVGLSRRYQKPTGVYTRKTFWDYYVGYQAWAKDYFGWFAHYYWPGVREPWVSTSWNKWDAWQFTDRGTVAGIYPHDLNWVKPELHVKLTGEEETEELIPFFIQYDPTKITPVVTPI